MQSVYEAAGGRDGLLRGQCHEWFGVQMPLRELEGASVVA
jgi:hypothetical protein